MVRGKDRDRPETQHFSPDMPKIDDRTKESPKRRRPERHEHLRTDRLNLPEKERAAGLHLVGPRRAILRWSALHDVRDEDGFPRKPDGGERRLEDSAGGSHERSSGCVLVPTRGLSDQEYVGIDRPLSRNRMCPSRMEAAPSARADGRGDLLQRLRAFVPLCHESESHAGQIALLASVPPLGLQVREGLDLRLNFPDLSFEFRADPLEFSLRLQAVDCRILERMLGPTNLRAVSRLDPSKPLQLAFDLVHGRNDRTSLARPPGAARGLRPRPASGRSPRQGRHWHRCTSACRGPRPRAGPQS